MLGAARSVGKVVSIWMEDWRWIEVGEQRLQGVMALGTMAATGVVLQHLRLSAACATQRFGDCGLAGGQ